MNDAACLAVSKATKPPPLVMNKKQLASYLDRPVSTINRWMGKGMPFTKEGKEYPEFYLPAVEKWLEAHFGERVIELRRVA